MIYENKICAPGFMKAFGITAGVVLSVTEVLLTVGLGIYAYSNPDPM